MRHCMCVEGSRTFAIYVIVNKRSRTHTNTHTHAEGQVVKQNVKKNLNKADLPNSKFQC